MARGKVLNTTKIDDIRSVYNYFERENKKARGKKKTDYQLRVATGNALKLSTTSVSRVITSRDTPQDGHTVIRPTKLDGFQKQVIKKTVHDFYAEKKLPTVPSMQAKLLESTDIRVSNETLRVTLHRLNYCFRKTTDNRRIIIERPEARAARARYVLKNKKNVCIKW